MARERNGQTTAERILEKFDALKRERKPFEDEWKDVMKYVLPSRAPFRDTKGKPERIGGTLYDGTPIAARNVCAYGMVGYMMSRGGDWFRLTLYPEELMEIHGVREWLEAVEKILYSDFRRSNFYEETPELMKDEVAIGNGGLFMREDLRTGTPVFTTLQPNELYLAEDQYGFVDTVFRRRFPTVRAAEQFFGEDKLSESTRKLAEKDPYERIEILHAVFPRSDRDVSKIDGKNKRFASVYLEPAANHVISEAGYDQLPYVTPRLMKQSGEVYGLGFGTEALTEIKTTNTMGRDILDASHLSVNPPLNVPEEMSGRLKLLPWGRNYYKNADRQVVPMRLGQDFPIGLDRQQDIRQIVQEHFLVDFFLMLHRAPEGMTATEVIERQGEKATVLGPVVQRIESDFLDRVLDYMILMAMRSGRVPPPPRALQAANQGSIEIEYIGPLAQAQKRFHATRGIQQAMGAYAPLLQINPQIADLVNWDELGRRTLQENGMPAGVIRGEEELEALRQARAKAEQAMAQQAQAAQQAEMYPKLAKAAEPGSPMAAMEEANRQAIQGGGA